MTTQKSNIDAFVASVQSLINDIQGMQNPLRSVEGDPADHDAQADDYFGGFSCWYDESDQTMCEGDGVRVCWPNLRISLEDVLKKMEAIK